MTNWMFWLVASAIVVALEMFLGTFYLLMVGIGLAGGALAALLGVPLEWQVLTVALVGSLATFGLRRRRGQPRKSGAAMDPNVNLDIGQVIVVDHWETIQGRSSARVMYRGAPWDVELSPSAPVRTDVQPPLQPVLEPGDQLHYGSAAHLQSDPSQADSEPPRPLPGRFVIREVRGSRFIVVSV